MRLVPKLYANLYAATQTGKAGPRQAIKMHCLVCVGYIREEVDLCSDKGSPLWRYRTGKGPKTGRKPSQAAIDALHRLRPTRSNDRRNRAPGHDLDQTRTGVPSEPDRRF